MAYAATADNDMDKKPGAAMDGAATRDADTVADGKQVRLLLENLASVLAEMGVMGDEADEAEAPIDEARTAKLEELTAKADGLRSQIERLRKVAAKERELRGVLSKAAPRPTSPAPAAGSAPATTDPEDRSMGNAVASRPFATPSRGHIRGFGSGPEAERRAFAVGQWALANLYGNEAAKRWCADKNNGIESRTQVEGTASLGGSLIPTILSEQVISLIDQFGTFKVNAKNVPMTSPYLEIPRRLTGLRMYPMGEGAATTATDKIWDKIALTARKWAVENRLSNEVIADAVIDLGSDITEEMGIAFAQGTDDCGFNGTGSTSQTGNPGDSNFVPNYQGIVGIIPAMAATVTTGTGGSAVTTGLAGVYQSAAATGFETFSIADFTYALAKVPLYARTANLKWYVSPVGWAAAMQRLMLTSGASPGSGLSGGNTLGDLQAGVGGPQFMGLPVVLCNALDQTLGVDNGKVKVILADLTLGAVFGSLRDITYRTSTERLFELDTTIMQSSARFDIKIHGVGTTAKPGPIVVMKTKAA
jgi:HK97 family phage major capsid protein